MWNVFVWLQSLSIVKKTFLWCLSETIIECCLTLQLPEAVEDNWANSKLTQELERKSWGMRWAGGLEKTLWIPWNATCLHRAVFTPRGLHMLIWKGSNSHSCLNLRLSLSTKWVRRQMRQSSIWVFKVCTSLQAESLGKYWETYWLRAFKETSVWSLDDYYLSRTEISVVTSNKEYRL